jgi:hypothetical protein
LILTMHLLAAKPAPHGLLDPKAAPIGLGSLAALAGRIASGLGRSKMIARVSARDPIAYSRSSSHFNVPKALSATALSQQFPLRLMLEIAPNSSSANR